MDEIKDAPFPADASIPDFNIELEYVPDPKVPDGIYNGIITGLKYNAELFAVQWEVTLQNNPGVNCDNGVTPVDGTRFTLNNWLPIPGDESTLNKKGITKRSSKISMMRRFASDMGLVINTPSDFTELINNRSMVGVAVVVNLKNRNIYTDVKRMERIL